MTGLYGVLNMPEYAWIIPEYACLNGFCLRFTDCNSISKGTIETFFLESKNLIFFSIVAGSIWFCFIVLD